MLLDVKVVPIEDTKNYRIAINVDERLIFNNWMAKDLIGQEVDFLNTLNDEHWTRVPEELLNEAANRKNRYYVKIPSVLAK